MIHDVDESLRKVILRDALNGSGAELTFDAPTNLVFVGPQLDRVVIANVGDRFLSVGDLGVRGQPLHYPVV